MNRPLVFWNAVSYHVVTWDIQPVSVGDPPTWCQFGLTELTARWQRCVTSVHGPSVALSHVGTPWKWKQKIKILVVFTDFQNSNHFFCFALHLQFQGTQHQGERHRHLLLIPLLQFYIYSQTANLWSQAFRKKLPAHLQLAPQTALLQHLRMQQKWKWLPFYLHFSHKQ